MFGTDGVRGVANSELTCELAYRLGQSAVEFLGRRIVVGKDTRLSGDMLEAALSAGVMSAGGKVLAAGIIPTPGVAIAVRHLKADGGIVISASHNPPEYNGIKFFDRAGFKLTDAMEDEIEAYIAAGGLEGKICREGGEHLPTGPALGTIIEVKDSREHYIQHCVSEILHQGVDLAGMHIALDTGHGAASLTSPEALRRLGARVTVINDKFNGNDINVNCGSTHLEPLRQLMLRSHADIGIAHDGDADRVMMLSPGGTVIDGDIIEAICALDMKRRGRLPESTVVSTIMCNLGFVQAMNRAGITVVQTKVGDRYVLEEMRAHGYAIGGEQSGHMILLDHNSTGDGLMTACQFLAAIKRSGKPVEQAISVMTRFPQVLINVRAEDKHHIHELAEVRSAVEYAESVLRDNGRVLLRPSGTEPVVRVMVEASDIAMAQEQANAIASVIEALA